MKKKAFAVTAVILMVSILTISANAFTISLIQQEKSNWCWASCCQAVIKMLNPLSTVTQTQIVIAAKGSAVDEGASLEEVDNVLSNYNVSSDQDFRVLNYQIVKQVIDTDCPIMAFCISTGYGIGHDVMVTSYYQISDRQYIGYRDPALPTGSSVVAFKISDERFYYDLWVENPGFYVYYPQECSLINFS